MADSFKPDSFKADLPGDSFKADSFTTDKGKTAGQGKTGLRLKTPRGQRDPSIMDWFPHAASATEPHASPDALMGGISDVGRFMAMAASPAAVGPALAAPIKTAVGLAAGYPIQQGVQTAGELLGYPGTGALAGDIAGVGAGMAAPKLTSWIPGTAREVLHMIHSPGGYLSSKMAGALMEHLYPPAPPTPDFGPGRPPNPASMPPRAPTVEAAYGPGRAPSPVPLPPRTPMPDVLYGPGRAPNPAGMPPRAPVSTPTPMGFGPGVAPNPAPMPPRAPLQPFEAPQFGPGVAPKPAGIPPSSPVQPQLDPLFGPGKPPNPARMPPRAPTTEEPGVPSPRTAAKPTPEIKPVQPTEDDWQDSNRALHAMAQEKELPGSPAGSRKGAHDYVKSLAKSLYNVNSTADLDVSQMKTIQEMIRTGKTPK